MGKLESRSGLTYRDALTRWEIAPFYDEIERDPMPNRRAFILQTAATAISAANCPRAAARMNLRPVDDVRDNASLQSRTERSKNPDALRLAIVGTGQISHRYLKQAAMSSRARFVATCARSIENAKARALEYGIDSWFDNYEKMLDETRPEAVVIATPTALHAPQAIAAFDRGLHVLCEKPMSSTLEECQAMVSAAQKSGKVFLSMPYDATSQMRTALAVLNEATLGTFTGAEAQLLLPGVSRDNWYYDKKVAGGGAGLDTLVYPVSRLVTLLGPAKRVTGIVNTLIPHRLLGTGTTIDTIPPPRNSAKSVKPTVDDNATLLIEWPNGQHAIVRALWGTSNVRNDSVVYGRHGTLWISGGDIILHSPEKEIPGSTLISWSGYKDCYRVPYQKDPKNEGLLEHFVDCIEGSAQPTCGGQQQLHVHEILFRGYQAASSGCRQELVSTFSPWHRIDPTFHDTRTKAV